MVKVKISLCVFSKNFIRFSVFRVNKKSKDLKKGAQTRGQSFLQLCDLRFLSYWVSNVHSRDRPGGTNWTMGIVLKIL